VQRRVVLVPCPRLHLIRFHGVLAPHAKLRAAIAPGMVEKQVVGLGEIGHCETQDSRENRGV
jgi:hypothetical protein